MNSILIILGTLGTTEIIIILIIILLLFGGKKIPELMRGIGRGVKEFKSGMNEEPEKKQNKDEENKETP